MTIKLFLLITTILAFIVVVFGAYVRLSNAGLGCPDWPGCYGHWMVPEEHEIDNNLGRPLETQKAWKEMIHRYLAGTLGLLILVLAIIQRHRFLSWFLVGLVIFQALLGMWTVTLKLHPLVVMAHLLGGLTTLGLLWWMYLTFFNSPQPPLILRGGGLALLVLILQIILGGWTSANYAALACPDFPTCQGYGWPPLNLKEAFFVWHDFGHNYEGGILHNEARMTIHWMHRLGALITFLLLGHLGGKLISKTGGVLKKNGIVILCLLVLQIGLGISNVLFHMPLSIAVAHNAVAVLLLLSLITVNRFLLSRRKDLSDR